MHETENYRGYTIEIDFDPQPQDPLEYEDGVTLVCSHRRYNLGTEQFPSHLVNANSNFEDLFYSYIQEKYDLEDATEEEVDKFIKDNIYYLPLYLYDHSGITMNTTGFCSGWDSGQVGYIYMDTDDIKNWYQVDKVTKEEIDKAYSAMESIVKSYDRYLTGQIFGYIIRDADDTVIESIWGYEYEKDAIADAKRTIDGDIDAARHKKQEKLKKYIKSGVPIIYRKLETTYYI